MSKPLVSIITPSYNSEEYIDETIQSVLAQTYPNWEMIIVDDFSKDSTKDIVKRYISSDNRIKLFELTHNSGPSVARNTAISKAKGSFIAFLDSDDVWLPNKLEVQVAYMLDNNYTFTYTPSIQIDENSQIIDQNRTVPNTIDYQSYLKNTVIGCLSVMINREKVKKISFPVVSKAEDMAAWLCILKTGVTAHGLNIELSKYRVLKTSRSSNKISSASKVWYIYREYEKLSLIKSIYCFILYSYNAIKRNWRLI